MLLRYKHNIKFNIKKKQLKKFHYNSKKLIFFLQYMVYQKIKSQIYYQING